MTFIKSLTEKIKEYKYYIAELLILSLPLLIGNLGHILIGAVDILVVAKYNIMSLAAISISNSILFTIFIFPLGIIDAITIILSNWRGQKQKVKKYLFSSLIFSGLIAVLFTVICYLTKYIIPSLGFEKELIGLIQEYISIVSFSLLGMFIFHGIKQFLQAYEIVKLPNIIIFFSVFINLILNIIFVFGFGPIPSMGSKGAAIATLTVRTLMGLIMLIYVFKLIDFKSKIDFSYMLKLIKTGVPIGIGLTLEFLAFNIITILAGREAGILSAVHNILITISSTTFMIPMSISEGLVIKVAYNYGAKRYDNILKYSFCAFLTGVGFMALAGLILGIFPEQIIKLFTDNKEVLEIAIPIVLIAALYQVFDGFQVIAGGILKGFKMTKAVSYSVLTGYWIVGVPIAYILVFKYNYSLKGYWIALAFSLLSMGIIQASLAKYKYDSITKEPTYIEKKSD